MTLIPMMCLLGIGIALFRRSPRAFLDGPSEDMPTRLLRWAAGLLSPQRGEWVRRCSANSTTSTAGAGGCGSRSAA
jgi:hypothetical protein